MAKKKQRSKPYRLVGGSNIQIIANTLRWRGKDVAELLDCDYIEDFINWLVQADIVLYNAKDIVGLRGTKEWQSIPEASYSYPEE